jgi:hypothetical protein
VSNPTCSIKKETIIEAMYSILACPKGCSRSAGFSDSLKLMSEIIKHHGDINKALNDDNMKKSSLDLNKLRKLAKDVNASANNNKEEYTIK